MATKKELAKIISTVNRHNGNKMAAAKELKINPGTLRSRLKEAADKGMKAPIDLDLKNIPKSTNITEKDLRETWAVYERYGYDITATAEALGVEPTNIRRRVKKAQYDLGFEKKPLGITHARSAKPMEPLPAKGEVRRVILTSAQNNTKLHDPTWGSLIELSKYYRADIKVATFTYIGAEGSEKRGKEKKIGLGGRTKGRHSMADLAIEARWYDERITPYIADEYEQLAPGLVWCGHWNSLPTALDPLRGAESLTGRSSGVFPHPRVEMRPIATVQGEGTKFNFTTGAVTLRNYIAKRAGLTAEFYHSYGALLVEIDSDGNWWPRQLSADSDGTIYDIDVYATPDGVWLREEPCPAVIFGDTHRRNIDESVRRGTWGKGGMVETLNPEKQVHHDLLDFESRSHHNRRDPHIMYSLYHSGRDDVWDEVREAGEFLDECLLAAPNSVNVVVDSNHDRHFDRWLKEADWRQDLPNARTILHANLAVLDAIERGEEDEFHLLEWAWNEMGVAKGAHVMNLRSEREERLSLVVCPANGGGIELGLHGDISPNGGRGNPRSLSKLGRKNVIGHSHSPGIWGGTYQVGVTGKLRQGYNTGPSSWAHAHCVVYPNGKRQIILFWNGKPWADRAA